MRVMHTDEAGPPDRRTRRSEPHSGSRRDGSPRDRAAVEIQVVTAGDSLISEIVTLADSASQTLGFLPPPVFEEAARDQTLLAALHGRELAGYALFGPAETPRSAGAAMRCTQVPRAGNRATAGGYNQ
jgi:hypothetical protein